MTSRPKIDVATIHYIHEKNIICSQDVFYPKKYYNKYDFSIKSCQGITRIKDCQHTKETRIYGFEYEQKGR